METQDNVHNHELAVPLKAIKKMVDAFSSKLSDDTMIQFETVLVSLFPTVLENIKKFGAEQYMIGYQKGFEDSQNENKRNN